MFRLRSFGLAIARMKRDAVVVWESQQPVKVMLAPLYTLTLSHSKWTGSNFDIQRGSSSFGIHALPRRSHSVTSCRPSPSQSREGCEYRRWLRMQVRSVPELGLIFHLSSTGHV